MTNQELNDLLARFEGSSLSKLKLSTQEFTIEMERAISAPAAPVIPAAAAAPAVPAAAEPEGDAITAPMVGTFYAASAPEQPPFVKVGDRVRKGQPVCLLEAMKMMSEIPAPCDCEITAVLKENGALVSFGEPLFRYQAMLKRVLIANRGRSPSGCGGPAGRRASRRSRCILRRTRRPSTSSWPPGPCASALPGPLTAT